jgi:PilZ domain
MTFNPTDRRKSPRLDAELAAQLQFSVLLVDSKSSADGVKRMVACAGHTQNLSEHGLALVIRARNISEDYLKGGAGSLRIELDLPNGPVEIQATPVRYQRLDESEAERGYLIGAEITGMSDDDRARYKDYLRTLS